MAIFYRSSTLNQYYIDLDPVHYSWKLDDSVSEQFGMKVPYFPDKTQPDNEFDKQRQ